MTTGLCLRALLAASSQDDILRILKDLKNAVIGSIWRKVEVVEDEPLLDLSVSTVAWLKLIRAASIRC